MDAAGYWDAQAWTFDAEPDHGLTDAAVREAWARLLLPRMPAAVSVADLGSGTGSLAVLLAEAGHSVFDVVVSRHVLWAMPDPGETLEKWIALLRPGGRLLLVEGRWATGGGLSAAAVRDLVLQHRVEADIVPLDDPALWGRPITDGRYLVASTY